MACHTPLVERFELELLPESNVFHACSVGHAISQGLLANDVLFRTHGGRPAALESRTAHIDVAFIAASASDRKGTAMAKKDPRLSDPSVMR